MNEMRQEDEVVSCLRNQDHDLLPLPRKEESYHAFTRVMTVTPHVNL